VPKRGEILRTTFDNFEILEQVMSGGVGEVYRAKNLTGEIVAIKVLQANQNTSKRKRFQREIKFCSQDVHPNIIRILDSGIYLDSSGERPFYVMPIYDGTLDDYLDKSPSVEDKLRVFVLILDGVEAAHKLGITHRDIKSKNILVSNDGSDVVIADFGIARFVADLIQHEVALTRRGERLANFEYAAPEQLNPSEHADERTDIYALGLLLYRIFTGNVPRGANPRPIVSTAPSLPYLDEIANAMIQNERSSRPQSIAEIKRMLIQRGHDFVQQQKLDELKKRVIPTNVISDPLIDDPIQIAGSDWNRGELILTLSQTPNGNWVRTLRGLRSFGGIDRAEPSAASFDDDKMRVPAPEHIAEIVYNHVRNWIQQTNDGYANNLRQQVRQNEEQQRRSLQEAIKREEDAKAARARVLEKLSKQSR